MMKMKMLSQWYPHREDVMGRVLLCRSSNNETQRSFGGPGTTKKRCQAPAATATRRHKRSRA